jgi:hypothetical protein
LRVSYLASGCAGSTAEIGQKQTFRYITRYERAKQINNELVKSKVSFGRRCHGDLAFQADEGQTAEYLMLQYPLQTDVQDRRLGLDGLYIERDDQAFGRYRGVQSIRRLMIASKSI